MEGMHEMTTNQAIARLSSHKDCPQCENELIVRGYIEFLESSLSEAFYHNGILVNSKSLRGDYDNLRNKSTEKDQ